MQTILDGEGMVREAWGCVIFELKKILFGSTSLPIAIAIFVTTNLFIIVSEGRHACGCSLTGSTCGRGWVQVDSQAAVEAGWGMFRDAYSY
jgi:hypothetical protein